MLFNEDKRIKLPVPFLQNETILYVDGTSGALHSFIEECKEELTFRFRDVGYTFLYLPDLIASLSPEMLHYLFPGQDDVINVDKLYRNIRETAKLGKKAGFLYKQKALTYFRAIPDSEGKISGAVDEFISSLDDRSVGEIYETGHVTMFREKRPEKVDETPDVPSPTLESWVFPGSECSSVRRPRFEAESEGPAVLKAEPLDPRKQALVDAWKKLEREFGITQEDVDFLLCYSIRFSRLFITTANRIFLPDWEGKPEVKMDDLTKSLYFFYLRHPGGVAFKELMDYEKEVYRIYLGITGRDDLDGIRKTVAGLVSPYSDVRNSCVSRIKKAFKDIVGERIAKYYYIDGRAGGSRSVSLDRDLVIWEH